MHSWQIGLQLQLIIPATPLNDAHKGGLFFYGQDKVHKAISTYQPAGTIPSRPRIDYKKSRNYIEKIEVAFRAAIADITSMQLGPFWCTDQIHYKNEKPYFLLMKHINRAINDKPEVFIKHYFNKYNEPAYPPIWMIIETLSFGTCSKLFANIKHVEHKKAISKLFGYPPVIIDSWIRTLAYVIPIEKSFIVNYNVVLHG